MNDHLELFDHTEPGKKLRQLKWRKRMKDDQSSTIDPRAQSADDKQSN